MDAIEIRIEAIGWKRKFKQIREALRRTRPPKEETIDSWKGQIEGLLGDAPAWADELLKEEATQISILLNNHLQVETAAGAAQKKYPAPSKFKAKEEVK